MFTELFFSGNSFNDFMNNVQNIAFQILDFLFGWIQLPSIDKGIYNAINDFLNIVFRNSSLLSFFLPINLLKIVLPLVLAVVGFKYYYKIIMWVINKIPFIDID